MKQIIPFYKEIVFKTNIASITSMSLEHQENILEGEVSGEFIIFGDYKIHNDTTEKENFKYKLPFTALIPDNIDTDTVVIDVEKFDYKQIDCDVIRIDIDFSIQGEILKKEDVDLSFDTDLNNLDNDREYYDLDVLDEELEKIDNEIDIILNSTDNIPTIELNEENSENELSENIEREQKIINNTDNKEQQENILVQDKTQELEEYVTYHIHIVTENDTLESISKKYNITLDYMKEYNDLSELKIGSKIIIPEYGEE